MTSKFKTVCVEKNEKKGRPTKHYHSLLKKEKDIASLVSKILSWSITNKICPKGFVWNTQVV